MRRIQLKLKTIPIILAILLCLIPDSINYAQDTTETKEDEWEWDWEYDEIKDWIHFGKKMPTISGYYGITDINDKQITQPLADGSLLRFDLGYTRRNTSRYVEYILKYSCKYL